MNAWTEFSTVAPTIPSDPTTLWGYGTRGLFPGGYAAITGIDYITTTTTSNAVSFGSLYEGRYAIGTGSNGSVGFMGGGFGKSIISQITFSTLSNDSSVGGSSLSSSSGGAAIHNKTICVFSHGTNLQELNMSTKTLSTFGSNNLSNNSSYHVYYASCNNGVLGFLSDGGYIIFSNKSNTMAYTDLGSLAYGMIGVSSDNFGNFLDNGGTSRVINFSTKVCSANNWSLEISRGYAFSLSDNIHGIFAGGSDSTSTHIDRLTIATGGKAATFGALTLARSHSRGMSGN